MPDLQVQYDAAHVVTAIVQTPDRAAQVALLAEAGIKARGSNGASTPADLIDHVRLIRSFATMRSGANDRLPSVPTVCSDSELAAQAAPAAFFPSELVDPKGAREMLGITASAVYQAAERGRLHPILIGDTRLYVRADVERYRLKSQQRRSA